MTEQEQAKHKIRKRFLVGLFSMILWAGIAMMDLIYMGGKDQIEFTYIGRHRGTFKNTRCIEPCTGVELSRRLQGHDVYISGSRFDPGPNHILEALAVGLPTYVHKDGGGAVEFAGTDHTFSNLSELEELILIFQI